MIGWSRKEALTNLTPGKHVTIGSRVRVTRVGRRDHQHPVTWEMTGRVVESGKANRWSAKNALGTTDAMRVEWDPTPTEAMFGSLQATNNGGPFAPGASPRR